MRSSVRCGAYRVPCRSAGTRPVRSPDGPIVRRARHRRGLLRDAVVARRPARRDLVPRAAWAERVRVRAEGRRRSTGPSGACPTTPASARGSASSPRTPTRHGVRFGFAISPGLDIDYESDADRAALLAKLAAAPRRRRPVVPAAARRHPDAAGPRAAPGRARDLAARASCARRAPTRRSRCARPNTSGRARRRTSPSSARACPPTST